MTWWCGPLDRAWSARSVAQSVLMPDLFVDHG